LREVFVVLLKTITLLWYAVTNYFLLTEITVIFYDFLYFVDRASCKDSW